MTPSDFIRKWGGSSLRERQGAQEHFVDLCRLLGEPTPAEDDPKGERYCFERGAEKVGGGDGWADVWRRGCFGWEYKGKHKDLNAALRQLQAYALDLQNPPYLVVCDMDRIVVHTNWTNTISKRLEFGLDDLRVPSRLEMLRQVFQGSETLKPGISPQELTAKVAGRFGDLGRRLQERGHEPRAVAHFLNRLIFCMFAEDARLLPADLFTNLVRAMMRRPKHAAAQLAELFAKMARKTDNPFFGADLWIIHFPIGTTESEAALFEKPFRHLLMNVYPHRRTLRRDAHRRNWWLHAEPRPGMFRALSPLRRFLATPRVAKHRFFVCLESITIPDSRLVVLTR